MILRPATPDDFAFIRSLAQRPEYAAFITDEDEVALSRYLSDPARRLLIWEDAAGPAGYALYCEIGDLSGRVELRRLALARAGKGEGAAFVRVLVDFAFTELKAAKLWLDASGENLRAQKIYDRAGFRLEGRLVQHWFRPVLGRTVDVMLYGMLRAEWAAMTLAAPAPQA